jgi:hypothetical protein
LARSRATVEIFGCGGGPLTPVGLVSTPAAAESITHTGTEKDILFTASGCGRS